MKYHILISCAFILASASLSAQEEQFSEETVSVSRPNVEGVSYRVEQGQIQMLFQWQGLLRAARPGQKTLLILTSDEPGSFAAPEIRKGAFIESFEILPQRREKSDLSQNVPVQKSYPRTVFIELIWRTLDPKPSESDDCVLEVEKDALKKELLKRGVRENIPEKYSQLLKTLRSILPDTATLKQEMIRLGYTQEVLRRTREELVDLYADLVQKQALLATLGLQYKINPALVKLKNVEKLSTLLLRLPGLGPHLKKPGPGADDHGEKALGWLIAQTQAYYDYALERPGAADRFSAEQRQIADTVIAFSIKAVFTPDERGEKGWLCSYAHPLQGGLLGEAVRQIVLSGRTDPTKGNIVHWWTVQATHPKEIRIVADEQTTKTHVFQYLLVNGGLRIRVRAVGSGAGEYTVTLTDTLLKGGDTVRVFANDQLLTSGFPY